MIVIVSITLVVVNGARRKGRDVACISNLSQMGKANTLYAIDHDDCLPPVILHMNLVTRSDFSSDRNAERFKSLMYAYGVKEQQFFCPLDEVTNLNVSRTGRPNKPLLVVHSWGRIQTSYRHDLSMLKYSKSSGVVTQSAIPEPAATWHMLDDATAMVVEPERYFLTGHGEFANVLFFDGHVKAQSMKP